MYCIKYKLLNPYCYISNKHSYITVETIKNKKLWLLQKKCKKDY